MHFGELIANLFAILLLASAIWVVFVFASEPIWPEHHLGKMVILLPPDATPTSSIKATKHPHLPDAVDISRIGPRPR